MIDHETLEDLYEQAPVGYLTVTAEDSIFRVNKTFLEWTGWKAEDLVGRKWFDVLLTPAGRALLDSRIEPLLQLQGYSGENAVDLVCADGERLPVVMSIARKGGEQGAPVFHRITLLESTERHSYERRLPETLQQAEEISKSLNAVIADLQVQLDKRTAELQAAHEELNAFSYGLSHAFSTDLRRVLACSRALRDDCGAQLDDKALGYLDRLEHSGHSIAELIDSLLQLSQSSRADLQRETINLSALAVQIVRALAEREPQRRVHWEVEPDLMVSADRLLMENALRHLFGNAWKYTAQTAEARIHFYAQMENDRRLFCLSDNGAGFDPQHAYRLFRPFQRLHHNGEFSGSGIGLTIVQKIIRRHGGMVDATASPGAGATFRFWLPDNIGA